MTANLEFPDNESPDFFLVGISNDVFRRRVTDFKGIENAFSGEGVDGAEIPRKAFRLSCSGEVGAEWIIREAGKEGTLEREVGGFTGRAKGDMGRTPGRGLSGRDELQLGTGFSGLVFCGGPNKFCKDEGIEAGCPDLEGTGPSA